MKMSELEVLFQFNCSTIFLLYPLGLDRKKLGPLGFIEAYLKDAEKKDVEYQNPVFLLFKPESPTLFQVFVEQEYERVNKYTGTIDIVEDYDYGNGYTVLVYEYPKEFETDYKRFLVGKYSRFSQKFKEIYPKVVKVIAPNGKTQDEIGFQFRLVHRTKDLKEYLEDKLDVSFGPEQEYFSKPDLTGREILSYDKIKILEGKHANS